MRTILIVLFILIFAIISIPLYLIEFIIGKISPHAKVRSSQFLVRNVFRIILFLSGAKVTVLGKERVPKNEAVLYVSNHRSYFDIVLAYANVPTLTGFIAKKEMAHIPCISHWMRHLNCLFLDSTNIKEGLKTILKGIELMKNGYSMYIAPEGTRNQEDEMLPFKEGSFKLAEKSGCAIIPVAVNNTEDFYELHTPWVHSTKTSIEFGEPIYIKDLSPEVKKALAPYVQNIIKDMYEKNRQYTE